MKVHKITVVVFVCAIGLTAVRVAGMTLYEKEAQLRTLKDQETNMKNLKGEQENTAKDIATKEKELDALWSKKQLTQQDRARFQTLTEERANLLEHQKAKFEEQAKLHAEQKKALNNVAKNKVLTPEALKARKKALLAQEKELQATGVEIGTQGSLVEKLGMGVIIGGTAYGAYELSQ